MFRRRTVLTLEALGARIAPSAVTVPTPAHTVATIVQRHYALTGLGTGHFQTASAEPDSGAAYGLSGTANLAGLGRVNVAGSLRGVGFIRTGHAGGTLTFSNSKGSVTVELSGLPEQPGFAPLPAYFRYHVVAGTGQYANLHESGTLRIDLHAGGTFRLAV